ncbi:uncharacterized protein LOC141700900 [Apium graveolens]|uniref:Uncharacterized protein n=1 Tax=Apium graveolens TaxID=4045 RepID=A0A6L5BD13_APIGR|nr:hypothetical protein AG4045_016888 [Apium graveolens]
MACQVIEAGRQQIDVLYHHNLKPYTHLSLSKSASSSKLSFVDDESYTSVYTLEEKDLVSIQPSEDNNVNNFKHLFTKINNPMHSPKSHPTLFVADQKLYVISHYCPKNSSFEVFTPTDQTWQVLPSPPYSKARSLDVPLLVLEQEHMVFFCNFLFSFNLQTYTWIPTADSIYYSNSDDTPSFPPTFYRKRVSLIGDMAFGFLYNAPEGNYICASRPTTIAKELMQPNLAPDQAFLEVLRSSRFTYMNNKGYDDLYSDYIVALQDLDGKQILCIVTYGTDLEPAHETGCYETSHVALTFFDIPGDFYTSKDTSLDSSYAYADDTTEDGSVARSYFNAKFRHTAHLVVSNSHFSTHGRLEACFF